MLKVASYDIVFQEIPGEVTLALNLSGCPCHCQGCHSSHLWEDIGEVLTPSFLDVLIEQYTGLITCVAFMGGDQAPEEVAALAQTIHQPLKTAWYSGRMKMPDTNPYTYVKLGAYVEALGGLKSPTTNQRLYQRVGDGWEDITAIFWKKSL